MESNKSELDTLIKNLSILVHTELESIGGELKSSETIANIVQLDSFRALDYISKSTDLALLAKKKAKETSYYSEFLNNETYQKEMQKLEHEIRNHIKIEQQMKLYADALEEKNLKCETLKKEIKKSNREKITKLKTENKDLKLSIADISKEIENSKRLNETSSKDILKNKGKENIKNSDIDKKLAKIEIEHNKLVKVIADAEKEYEQQKKDNEELKAILKGNLETKVEERIERDSVKNKYDSRSNEFEVLRKKVKYPEPSSVRKNNYRSITPNMPKTHNIQSSRIIRKVSSNDKINPSKIEKILQRSEKEHCYEKKRLPLSFTSRR
jgi:chromosome segregation ATPase